MNINEIDDIHILTFRSYMENPNQSSSSEEDSDESSSWSSESQ